MPLSLALKHFSVALNPRSLLQWCKIWRSRPVTAWIIGAHYFRKGAYNTALEHYRVGLERAPRHRAASCARLDYAYCLYRTGSWADAREELYRLIDDAPRLREAYVLLAEIETVLGRGTSTTKVLQRFLEHAPDDAITAALLAHAQIELGASTDQLLSLRESLHAIREREEVEGYEHDVIATAVAHLELTAGDSQVGEQLLSRVIAGGGCFVEALLIRGEWLLKQGRMMQARKYLERAMRSAPRHPRAPMLLARAYLAEKAGDPAWAVRLATIACQRSFWQNPQCLQTLAEAYERNKEHDAALLVAMRMKEVCSLNELDLETFASLQRHVERLTSLPSSDVRQSPGCEH